MSLLIKNGRVIDPANKIDNVMDVFVQDGVIQKVSESIENPGSEVVDATGMWVTPGLIDLHVHLREPGFTHKETVESGTRAAAAGGFTTICQMPNTNPTIDSGEAVEYFLKKNHLINVLTIGSITKGLEGKELSAIEEMKKAGICAISDDGKSVENPRLLYDAMLLAKEHNLPVFSHCEDLSFVGTGQINEGRRAEELGLEPLPPEAEVMVVARDIILAKKSNVRLHICHISTAGAIQYLRWAKIVGQSVTAEVAPHHFTLTCDDIPECDANYKMSPPLRSPNDIKAIVQALRDGTIDVIATDHAPHTEGEKNAVFKNAPNGIIGLETAVPLSITALVKTNILTPSELVEKFTWAPARVLGLALGNLTCGQKADIAIIDPDVNYMINKHSFASLGKNTPFHGKNVSGKVMYTVCGGKVVFKAGK